MLLSLKPLYNCTYVWCKFFNTISVDNYSNQSGLSFKSCSNLFAGHNVLNPCVRKRQSVKAGMENRGTECEEWGGNAGNRGRNAGNLSGNAENLGWIAGNQGGNTGNRAGMREIRVGMRGIRVGMRGIRVEMRGI